MPFVLCPGCGHHHYYGLDSFDKEDELESLRTENQELKVERDGYATGRHHWFCEARDLTLQNDKLKSENTRLAGKLDAVEAATIIITTHLHEAESRVAELEGELVAIDDGTELCDSCGEDNLTVRDHLCRGCGLIVCQPCVDVFDHSGEGLHGKGDPRDAVTSLRSELTTQADRIRELEGNLVLATHQIADDNGSPDMPYCVECEAGWPCAPFKEAEKARASAKAAQGGG